MRRSRGTVVLLAALTVVGFGATWWFLMRSDGEVIARNLSSGADLIVGAIDCNAPPYGGRITGTAHRDVVVATHGTVCRIRGTVQGTVTVRDEACDDNDAITAVDVVGGTVEGDIVALGGTCVMVFLEDGARINGDVIYRASGNLGFLGDGEGASIHGSVLLAGGALWAHGRSTANLIDGDLVCEGGRPKEGLESGSEENWDGFQDDVDGTIGGSYRSC